MRTVEHHRMLTGYGREVVRMCQIIGVRPSRLLEALPPEDQDVPYISRMMDDPRGVAMAAEETHQANLVRKTAVALMAWHIRLKDGIHHRFKYLDKCQEVIEEKLNQAISTSLRQYQEPHSI